MQWYCEVGYHQLHSTYGCHMTVILCYEVVTDIDEVGARLVVVYDR